MWHIIVFILNVFFVSTSWAACPSKWTEYNGRCYFFTTQAYRYNDALNLCSTRNSTLVIIRSNDDWSWLRGQIHTLQTDNYWIGLRVSNRSWVWVDGTTYNQANV